MKVVFINYYDRVKHNVRKMIINTNSLETFTAKI